MKHKSLDQRGREAAERFIKYGNATPDETDKCRDFYRLGWATGYVAAKAAAKRALRQSSIEKS